MVLRVATFAVLLSLFFNSASTAQVSGTAVETGIKGHMPHKGEFNFRDLGYGDITIEGIGSSPPIEFNTAPGIKLIGPNQLLRVHYSYGPLQRKDALALEVKFNNHILGSFPLYKVNGEPGRRQDLQLPVEYFSSHNDLKFAVVPNVNAGFSGLPSGDVRNTLTIFGGTALYVDAEHILNLPDLALWQEDGAPFTLEPGCPDLTFVLPENPPLEVSDGFGELSSLLKDWSGGTKMESSMVRRMADVPPGQNVIELNVEPSGSWERRGPPRHLSSDEQAEITERMIPGSPNRVLLRVVGTTPEKLKQALSYLVDPEKRALLKGDTFTISGNKLKSRRETPVREVYEMPMNRYVSIWMSERQWFAPAFLLVLGLCLWLSLRTFTERKKQQFVKELKG